MAYSDSDTEEGAQNKDFGAVSQTDLTRGSVFICGAGKSLKPSIHFHY